MCLVLVQLGMPYLADIPERPAVFSEEMEEEWIRGEGRLGQGFWEERREGKLQLACNI